MQIKIFEVSFDGFELVPDVCQALLEGDEALDILALFEHRKEPFLLRAQRREPRLIVCVLRGHVFGVPADGGDVSDALGLMEERFKAGGGDADGVICPAVDDGGRAVVIVARVAIDVRALDEAAESCDLCVERCDGRVKVGRLGGEVCRVDDLGGNVGRSGLGRVILRDLGRHGERAVFGFHLLELGGFLRRRGGLLHGRRVVGGAVGYRGCCFGDVLAAGRAGSQTQREKA